MIGPSFYTEVEHISKDDMIVNYAPLVKRIAYHLLGKLPPTVEIDDLIQAGMIGLLEASSQYDASHGASFRTYAGIRIRGAILDEVRRLDWTPRSVHKKAREVAEKIHELENRQGRDPSDADVVKEMGITMDEYHQILQDSSNAKVFSFDQFETPSDENSDFSDEHLEPLKVLHKEGFKKCLVEAIKKLCEREQLLMSLYYDDELNLKEIGEILGVSESRASQLHGKIMLKLRKVMQEWSKFENE
ncbi:MAG: RNA polymerase sigma factor FliA [Gammaproteobacteria bacterium]|nr:MAG: RNA polymerase sigma factor FliA [Gammaproteobacteria bacterium]